MPSYPHHIFGFFVKREEAEIAQAKIIACGVAATQLQIFSNEHAALVPAAHANSNTVLKDMLVDGAIGTSIGTGLGALGELALVAADVTLFVASPLIAPLVMLGWGASLGAVVGAITGAVNQKPKDGTFSNLVSDAIASGQVVLIVTTISDAETRSAKDILHLAVGSFKEAVAQ